MGSKKSRFWQKIKENKIGCNTNIFTEESSFLGAKILRKVIKLSGMNQKNALVNDFSPLVSRYYFFTELFLQSKKLDHNILPMRKMDKTEIS
jgi:hypothetical protein